MSDGHGEDPRPPGYRLMLREMAADERPREKLKLCGSAVLSDGELLAIILNTGIRCETVNDVFQRLLALHHGLCGLLRLDVAELALRDCFLSQRLSRQGPGPSISGARPGRSVFQNTPKNRPGYAGAASFGPTCVFQRPARDFPQTVPPCRVAVANRCPRQRRYRSVSPTMAKGCASA